MSSLFDIIREHRAEILSEWERRMRPMPVSKGHAKPAIASRLPALLENLMQMAGGAAGGGLLSRFSGGSENPRLEHCGDGIDSNLVLTEYFVLRDCILELLERCDIAPDPTSLRMLSGAIDQGIAASIHTCRRARDQAQQRLREQLDAERAWLSAVLEQMPCGVLIGDALCGRTLLSNRQAEEIWRFPPCQPGKRDEERHYRGFHPDDGRPYEPEEWPLSRTILQGETVSHEEIDFLRGNGTFGTMLVSSAPIRDRNHKIIAGTVIFHDITERKQVEKALRFLSTTSKLLAESMDPDETLRRTAKLCVPDLSDWSFATVLRQDHTLEKVAIETADSMSAALAAEVMADMALDVGAGAGLAKVLRTGEAEFVPKMSEAYLSQMVTDESARDMLAKVAPHSYMCVPLMSRGRVLGTLSLAMTAPGRRFSPLDLETAKEIGHRAGVAVENAQLYEHARRAVQAREQVLAVVSHDLRNPLNAIHLGAALLLAKSPPGEQGDRCRQVANRIIHTAQQMAGIIKDLLDTTSIDAGRLAVDVHNHELDGIVTDALEMLHPLAAEKSIRLQRELADTRAVIRCDRERILQVLSNLIGNAVKFTGEGGVIAVGGKIEGDHVLVQVRDTGPGIAECDISHIFDLYWQAKDTAGQKKGFGLGLAIAKAIVQAHEGTLWAESTLGQGSTFFFTLPIAAAE